MSRSRFTAVPVIPSGWLPDDVADVGVTDSDVAAKLDATPMQVALAWLLRRSTNILLIPGTSSVAHLRENVAAASLVLPDEMMTTLGEIGRKDMPE